jgi:predicted permease
MGMLTVWPLFALIGLGYSARQNGLLTPGLAARVHAFVYYVALPALLVQKVAAIPLPPWHHWRLVGAYYSASGMVVSLALVLGWRWLRQPLAVRGLLAVAAVYPNVGYLGLPLVLSLCGEAGMAPAVLFFLTDNVLGLSAATAFAAIGRGAGQPWYRTVGTLGLRLARNPMLGAVSAGIVLASLGWSLPLSIAWLSQRLGAAATPGALIALGAALAAVGRPTVSSLRHVALPVGLKLLVHPMLVWVLVTYVLPGDPLWRNVALLEASLPTATTVYVVAQQYDLAVELVATTICLATGVALATVSVLVGVLAP